MTIMRRDNNLSVFSGVVIAVLFLISFSSGGSVLFDAQAAPPLPEKVPLWLQASDPHTRGQMRSQGLDPEFVELVQDYGRRWNASEKANPANRGKPEPSPYSRTYRDTVSGNKFVLETQGLPMVDHLGNKVAVGWQQAGPLFMEKNNLFRAVVQGTQVTLTVRNAQPDGRKANDRLTFDFQMSWNGVQMQPQSQTATLLAIDPVNANYQANVLEWNYSGMVKRRMRLVEGNVLGSWVFLSDPMADVLLKYNQTGDYRLKLGQFKVNDDEEFIPASVFASATYPFEVSDSATYYPNANPETTSVDGFAERLAVDEIWATLIAGAGTTFDDSSTVSDLRITATATASQWSRLGRGIYLYDTSGLPDNAVVSAAVLSLYGSGKIDNGTAITPDINIYTSTPASNTGLANADYGQVQAVAQSTAITYANWSTIGYNDFALNDMTKISLSGVSKFGSRNANYDVAASAPTWSSGSTHGFENRTAEAGDGYKPKLVVTYTVPVAPTLTLSAATSVTGTTATLNGNVTDTGGDNPTVTVYWGDNDGGQTPGSWDNSSAPTSPAQPQGVAAFTKNVTSLSPGTTYYFSAAGTNTGGTGWPAAALSFTTATAPTVTTQAVSNPGSLTPVCNGNITATGGTNATSRGCQWDVDSGAPYANTINENGSFGTGAFTEDMTGLPFGVTIYARAFATQDAGTGYGSEVSFLRRPDAPTNVAATDGTYTDKVTITWTQSTGATQYRIKRDDVTIITLGDVATYDDTGADAPTITAGSAVATDGTETAHVALSLSGTSANNGTTHAYKVVAVNSSNDSTDSSPDNGYRGVGSLTYQWQRSAGDSDASYSNIDGATTSTYNDTAAPAGTITPGTGAATEGDYNTYVELSVAGESTTNGAGRYYRAVLNATGATQQTATANRGYRGIGSITYQWYRSSGDADSGFSAIVGATTDPYNDTAAPNPTITPGAAVATDGTSSANVGLSISGLATASGAGRYFYATLSATGATSQDTTHARGYKGIGTLTYQWQRSSGDSDASYSNIGGATTATYNDTGAPIPSALTGGTATASDGTAATVALSVSGNSYTETGRYFRVVIDAQGADQATSTANRGYRSAGTLTYLWFRSGSTTDAAYTSVSGLTTASATDSTAPASAAVRYYKVFMWDSLGATPAWSTADSGYRTAATVPYAHSITYTITNGTESALTNTNVLLPVNAAQLITANYVDADLLNVELQTGGSQAIYLGYNTNGTWPVFISSLAAHASMNAQLYLNTTSDIAQMGVVGTTTSDTATHDASQIPGTTAFLLEAVGLLTASDGQQLICKNAAYCLDTTGGNIRFRVWDNGASPISVTAAIPASEATIVAYYNGALASNQVTLIVNGSSTYGTAASYTVTSTNALIVSNGTRYTKLAKLTINTTPMGHWYGVTNASNVSQDLASGSTNDATITISVSQPAGVTVTAGPLTPASEPIATPPASANRPNFLPTPAVGISSYVTESPDSSIPFYALFSDAADNLQVSTTWVFAFFVGSIAVGLSIAFYRQLPYLIIAVGVVSAVLLVAGRYTALPMWPFFLFAGMSIMVVLIVKRS